jgi:hypothetical protein
MVARAKPKRMYRTMQGRMVDIDQLRAANDATPAVGNMKVNARGDVLGPKGQIVKPKAEVIKKYYEHPKGMADDRVIKNPPPPQPQARPVETKKVEVKPAATKKVATPKATPKKPVAPKKGIDEALDGLE